MRVRKYHSFSHPHRALPTISSTSSVSETGTPLRVVDSVNLTSAWKIKSDSQVTSNTGSPSASSDTGSHRMLQSTGVLGPKDTSSMVKSPVHGGSGTNAIASPTRCTYEGWLGELERVVEQGGDLVSEPGEALVRVDEVAVDAAAEGVEPDAGLLLQAQSGPQQLQGQRGRVYRRLRRPHVDPQHRPHVQTGGLLARSAAGAGTGTDSPRRPGPAQPQEEEEDPHRAA